MAWVQILMLKKIMEEYVIRYQLTYIMINNQYQTKRRRKRAFAKALTQKDETIPLFVGRTKELEHKPRTFGNIFLNGKQLTSHYSHCKTIEPTTGSLHKSPDLGKKASPKKLNLNQYIYKKYLTESCEHQSDQPNDEHPEKLISLQKIFHEKYKAKAHTGEITHQTSKSPRIIKHRFKTDSQMIKVTNPEIYSHTFLRKFHATKHINQSEVIPRHQTIKYRLKEPQREKPPNSKINESLALIEPWQVD